MSTARTNLMPKITQHAAVQGDVASTQLTLLFPVITAVAAGWFIQ
jgi:hypothetical protein